MKYRLFHRSCAGMAEANAIPLAIITSSAPAKTKSRIEIQSVTCLRLLSGTDTEVL